MKNNISNLVVQKFGGSSLADAQCFKRVKSLLTGKNEIIVVSAVKDVTSLLQTILDEAKSGHAYTEKLLTLENLHLTIIHDLLPADQQADLTYTIKLDLQHIQTVLTAVKQLHAYSQEMQEDVLGYGEQWSAKILVAYLKHFYRTEYLDAAQVLFVEHKNGVPNVDWEKSQQALNQFLQNQQFDQLVVTGFIARTLAGKRTILGRNGSDFSGAIFAKLFNATALYIWTDVDGIFTADPHRVQAAFPVEAISYKEAMELACFGAKILHPLTILPMLEQQIPIYIKNTFNPTATGTAVVNTTGKSPYLIRGLSCIDQVALINVEGAGMIGVVGIAARVFQILQHIQVSVILISQASSEHSICFAVPPQQAETALKALNEQLATEMAAKQIDKISVDRDCAILAMIGDAMVGSVGILNKLCHSLAKANINIRAVAQGSSERNISIVIKREDVNKALQVVHAGLYLSNKVIAIGLIGPGLVGGALLEQIAQMSEQLKEKYHVQLCVRGIMTSKKMLLNRETIALQYWRDDLAKSNQPADLQAFTKHLLSDDMPHAVLIDCTASPMIAKHYADFIEQGLHVITPNKHTNGGDLEYYKKTKALAQKKQRYYLYEATVCAGLPVMSTLHDIINTGDEVLAIEGVFSGTLSYIFNELATGKPFSEIVLAAKKAGYTEPDPREDLSGMDVARKLICLAREIGRDVSLQDIHVHNLVPEALKSCSVEEFLEKLSECDAQMEKLMLKAREKNEKLYYMGAIRENGTIDVAIESFPAQHPFTRLNGTDNMLIFHTRRYHTQPLVIQGPGAGADVTAAGIFADLLRLASSLS